MKTDELHQQVRGWLAIPHENLLKMLESDARRVLSPWPSDAMGRTPEMALIDELARTPRDPESTRRRKIYLILRVAGMMGLFNFDALDSKNVNLMQRTLADGTVLRPVLGGMATVHLHEVEQSRWAYALARAGYHAELVMYRRCFSRVEIQAILGGYIGVERTRELFSNSEQQRLVLQKIVVAREGIRSNNSVILKDALDLVTPQPFSFVTEEWFLRDFLVYWPENAGPVMEIQCNLGPRYILNMAELFAPHPNLLRIFLTRFPRLSSSDKEGIRILLNPINHDYSLRLLDESLRPQESPQQQPQRPFSLPQLPVYLPVYE